jgi:hypothetical protein
MSNRDDFSPDVKETLAKRVGMLCSRCGRATSGPHENPSKAVNIGVAAHIREFQIHCGVWMEHDSPKLSGRYERLIQHLSKTFNTDGPSKISATLTGLGISFDH